MATSFLLGGIEGPELYIKESSGVQKLVARAESTAAVVPIPSTQPSGKTTKIVDAKTTHVNKSKEWYQLPTPELTPQLKSEIALIYNRGALDPKRNYKASDWSTTKGVPKQFAVGTLLPSATETSAFATKRRRQEKSLVDHILENPEIVNKYRSKLAKPGKPKRVYPKFDAKWRKRK